MNFKVLAFLRIPVFAKLLYLRSMTLSEFLALNEYDQAELVWGGTYLNQVQLGQQRHLLYQVGNFFVEVIYSGDEGIARLKPITRLADLKHHVLTINIGEIERLL